MSAHTFTAAVAARDIDAVAGALAPDAVLHSPITNTPFEGREVISDLYQSLFAQVVSGAREEARQPGQGPVDDSPPAGGAAAWWRGSCESPLCRSHRCSGSWTGSSIG
jgi:hypothetical protein